ncbi:MAG: metallophosphoesterase [Cellulosilyticaceae bacterium]
MISGIFRLIKNIIKLAVISCLAVSLLYIYTTEIEPKLLRVIEHNISVEGENAHLEDIKIVQFTDTHVGAFFEKEDMQKVIHKINELEADIVVFTGDLVDHWGKYDEENELSELLKSIKAPLGKFAVYGNHDYGGGGYKIYKKFMENSGFNVLINEVYTVALENEKQLNIAGLDDALLGEPQIDKLMKQIDKNDYNILLAHEPDIADEVPQNVIDIQLSGHSHGGQVELPGVTERIVPTYAKNYIEGMYQISPRTKLYVNTGIGSTQVPFRLGNIPEITLLTFNEVN